MFLNFEDLTKVSHRDFKGFDTDKRIPRKEKDYRDKWSTSSSAALRKTCSPQFKLFNVCIGWFFFLQHCSFYNAWLQLSEKHVELIISYQGFSTTVFLLAIASRTFCTFMDYSLATSSSNAFSPFISVLNNIFNRTLKNENVRTTVIVIPYKGILFKQNTLSLLWEKKDERIRIPPFASIITSEMTAILFIYWQTVAIVAAVLF